MTAVARLPFVDSPMTTDEGGFLTVARQWTDGHGSLYGHYWVDRPPLIIEFFRIADDLGGLVALRLIGCVLASATVLIVGLGVTSVWGRRAGLWSSVVTGALLASPLLGSVPVNGELIAAPFVAGAVGCTVRTLHHLEHTRALRGAAMAAGASATAAILIKQNMIDGVVFAVVAAVVSRRLGGADARPMRSGFAWFVGGAMAAVGFVLALAAVRGTSPGAIFFAMYPFRLRAAHLTSLVGSRVVRLHELGIAEVASLAPLVLFAFVVVVAHGRRRARSGTSSEVRSSGGLPRHAFTVAVAAMIGYGCVSILVSGSYWSHYLVELAVPLGCAAGVVAANPPRWVRAALVAPVVAALVSVVAAMGTAVPAPGQIAGSAIGAAARRNDSIVVVLGSSDIVESSGLRSPYRYLWSLPARVLDPHMNQLRGLLGGPDAPTWFVVRSTWTAEQLQADGLDRVLARRYREVADVCGRVIYLRAGFIRRPPYEPGSCNLPLAPWLHLDTATRSGAASTESSNR